MKKSLIIISIVSLAGSIGFAPNAFSFSYKDMDLDLDCSAAESYDDNITSVHTDEKKDFITDLHLGLGLEYVGKNRSIELEANIDHQFFARYSSFDNTSEDVRLKFKQELSKYDRIGLTDVFSHTFEPQSFEEAFGRMPGRYGYIRNNLDITYSRDISKQLSLSLKYANELNDITRKDISDSYLNRAGIEASYFHSSKTILMGLYNLERRDFHPGSSVTTNSITGGIRHYLTNQLYFDGRAGMDIINSYDNEYYTKPFLKAGLTTDLDENSTAAISFTKRYYSNSYSEDLFDYWETNALFTKQLFKKLSCSITGFYGEGKYIAEEVTDKLVGAGIGLKYNLNKRLNGDLRYTYTNADSTLITRQYARNKIFLGISMDF